MFNMHACKDQASSHLFKTLVHIYVASSCSCISTIIATLYVLSGYKQMIKTVQVYQFDYETVMAIGEGGIYSQVLTFS